MKIKMIIAALVLPLLIVSCGDNDDPVTPSNADYFPMKAGNYWIYDTYDLDMQNNPDQESKELDSLVTISSINYLQRDAFHLKQFTDGSLNADRYYDNESGKIYVESSYLLPLNAGIALPLDQITNQWVVLADINATSEWSMFTHQFTNQAIEVPGLTGAKITAQYSVKGSKGTKSTIYGKEAQEFIVKHTVSGNVIIDTGIFPVTIPLSFTITQKYYFAEDIGMVKVLTESQTISLNVPLVGTQTIDVNGHVKNLIRHKVVL